MNGPRTTQHGLTWEPNESDDSVRWESSDWRFRVEVMHRDGTVYLEDGPDCIMTEHPSIEAAVQEVERRHTA